MRHNIRNEACQRWLGKGETVEAILGEYPGLSKEDIHAAQSFAADPIANDRIVTAAE